MTNVSSIEEVIEPNRAIVDSHHHLHGRFVITPDSPLSGQEERLGIDQPQLLVEEYASAVAQCNVTASVIIEAGGMYRKDGPDDLKPVGETEFLNGQAAMAASGVYGPCRMGAAIISHGNLMAGERVRDILEAHMAAAPDRFRGVRQTAGWDEDTSIFGWLYPIESGMYLRDDFRAGFKVLDSLGLVFDAFVLAPQMDDVADLAHRFPGTPIVVEHLAVPVGIGRFSGRLNEEFSNWSAGMARLSRHDNIYMKIGGLGSFVSNFPSFMADPPYSSQQLAEEWRPYVETAIELFGADRCMFNSDLPTNRSGSFLALSNAYKRITAGCSEDEKNAIFSGTAAEVYRLDLSA